MSEWEETGAGNYILQKEGFFVSFNPDTGQGSAAFFDILLGHGPQGAETAIVTKDGDRNKYFILRGDHRDPLENLDLDGAKDYFNKHIELAGPTSDFPSVASRDLN